MKIISCASYYGTGSSAIVDYFSEFSSCFSFADYEFRFVHDPNGISDLEYNLVENHNRNNSGYALKKYRWLVDFYHGNSIVRRYEPFFEGKWKDISYNYINALTDFQYKGYWFHDVLDKGKSYYVVCRILNKILQKTIWRMNGSKKIENNLNELPNEWTLCARPSKERFLELTRNYIDTLIGIANKKQKPYVMVDQIVPASNINRYLRYFNDITVYIVDRDPRDIYYLAKYVWKIHIIPTENTEVFCKWFRYTREHRKTEQVDCSKVMFVQFEDMVLHYEETMIKIRDFCGMSKQDHVDPYKYFNPKVSINNIHPWSKTRLHLDEMEFIAKELPEYIYNFKT